MQSAKDDQNHTLETMAQHQTGSSQVGGTIHRALSKKQKTQT